MPLYYDDNFGCWDNMDDPEMQDFYFDVQKRTVEKVCAICERTVFILPQYDKCGRCADAIEKGYGY